uniref:Uncharacterized protein n=1 Tax=Anguilla anguilla TaxID=7936 RepID=A0A0E9RAJ9_ANGAN
MNLFFKCHSCYKHKSFIRMSFFLFLYFSRPLCFLEVFKKT